ncbi:3-hydroxyisobutyryl-coenzyme a hydrolase [Tribonema minus]|uniref:3-hydroxyisobutyryl-CoA hydrolase n=1 Tax=Tribonema minus TaxID=303371 RepID=A0A835ZAS6_9STRA|nr:3-hydroxyisobutyryl-coenzyme a hydrolase [Tribonema minus]
MLLGRLPSSRIASSSSHSVTLSLARCITHCRAMSSAGSGSSTVLTDRQGGVATLIMNRERALNALSLKMCTSMHDALKLWLPDPSLRCLILKGAGTKAFCAGGDVKSIATEQGAFTPGQPGTLRCDFFREEYKLDWALARAKAVSLWNGIVMGGGVGVSIHGAFRVATETTLWAMPETAIGLFPDVGASFVLARLPGGLGAYIALLGARLRACDLLYAGLATHCVAADRRAALIDADGRDVPDILARFSSAPPPPPKGGPVLEPHRDAIDRCFGGKNGVEGVVAALRAEGSEWSRATLEALLKMSPTALKVTHHQLSLARGLSLRGCFVNDFRASQRRAAAPDFVEGVRAVLVDKDGAPRWRPAALEDVSAQDVEGHFATLGAHDLVLPPP